MDGWVDGWIDGWMDGWHGMARGYAYVKIEYVSVRTYLSKNRIRVRYVLYARPRPVRNATQENVVWPY